MTEEIINRVANSDLITIDLEDYAPQKDVLELDVKRFLFKGVILKEKEFRSDLKSFDFSRYKNAIVAVFCSSDAILPMWSYMLIASYLNPICCDLKFGKKEDVVKEIILEKIDNLNEAEYNNKKVIVKGCGSLNLDESVYIAITKKLQKNVSSLMFGEACSAVPVYKKKV